jgi:MoxR-like ATPase
MRDHLESFDPAERARAGQDLVRADLSENAKQLLAHLDNEFDDRVVAAIAHAIVASPGARREPKRVAKLRARAEEELARLEVEERFFRRGGEPVEARPEQSPRSASGPTYISWHPPG